MLLNTDRIQLSAQSGSVYFSPVQKDDEGTYNCTASNDVGSATSVGSLTVKGLHLLAIFYRQLAKDYG